MMQTELNAKLNDAIEVFLTVLRTSWPAMTELANRMVTRDTTEVLADWAQANWEMIVEAALSTNQLVFTEPYGEGADCNSRSSRVWKPDADATHIVHCISQHGGSVTDVLSGQLMQLPDGGLPFERFVSRTPNGWYLECPPFDHALLFHERETLIALDEVRFVLMKIE
jgi:hypothetical protein